MFSKIRSYFIRTIFFSAVVLVGIMLTGAIERSYDVLNEGDQITIQNTNISIQDLANEYFPRVVMPEGLKQENLEQILYEVIDSGSVLTVNYYFKWKSEIHPDPAQNILNKIWNFIYFKFNVYDIEYLQIDVNKASGQIEQVKFDNGLISKIESTPNLQIGGWKHNFQIGNNLSSSKYLINKVPEYFEAGEYKHLKMARRSQGDFQTNDNPSNIPIIIFLAFLATYYFRHVQKDYDNEYASHH